MKVHLYHRKDSPYYWMNWKSQDGKEYFKSTKCQLKKDAVKVARKKEEDLMRIAGYVDADDLKVIDLIETVEWDYEKNNKRSINKLLQRKKHILRILGEDTPLASITEDTINYYIKTRKQEPGYRGNNIQNATINRELAIVKRGYNLLKSKIGYSPKISKLTEDNVRTGYVERVDYETLIENLPLHLSNPVKFAYRVGWREDEIFGLMWDWVNLNNETVSLPAGFAKNKIGRTYRLSQDMYYLFKELMDKRTNLPWVFLNKKMEGRVKDFRFSWNVACRKAGLGYGYNITREYVEKWSEQGLREGPIFHDLRRSVVRNLLEAGVPENVAMVFTGFKTRSVFDRYAIVSPKELSRATDAYSEFLGDGSYGEYQYGNARMKPMSDAEKERMRYIIDNE